MSSRDRSITKENARPLALLPTAWPEAAAALGSEGEAAAAPPAASGGALPGLEGVELPPGSQLIVQPGLRTIFIRPLVPPPQEPGEEAERAGLPADVWKSGSRLPTAELTVWLRRRRRRELCLLAMLDQHRYLTSEHIQALFWPGRTRRAANLLLRWLALEMRLVMRWIQLEPVVDRRRRSPSIRGWRRKCWLYLLTERGAAVLARDRRLDPAALVKRSWYAAEYCYHLEHDLETNSFFVGLAAASRELPDQGLFNWVGDDSMRRNYEELGVDLRPDGWGRYLTAGSEVLFSLEWDRGTEGPGRLNRKARAYVAHAEQSGAAGEHNHVLLVAPGRVRERSLRAAVGRALGGPRRVRFWTTHAGLLRERGVLGEVWLQVAGVEDRRLRLPELPGPARSERRIEDCIGKPGWWERRPGGGEGA